MLGSQRVILCLWGALTVVVAKDAVFISPQGSDESGNGSESSPFKTLAHALQASSDGGTINVKQGYVFLVPATLF